MWRRSCEGISLQAGCRSHSPRPQGKYILTGDLTASIFAHDCRFVDPNNAVDGLAKYRQALSFLFDPLESDLRLSELVVEDGKRLRARYVASGTLKLRLASNFKAF